MNPTKMDNGTKI